MASKSLLKSSGIYRRWRKHGGMKRMILLSLFVFISVLIMFFMTHISDQEMKQVVKNIKEPTIPSSSSQLDTKTCTEERLEAYVTLLISPELLNAAEMLAYRFKHQFKTTRDVVALITFELSSEAETRLRRAGFTYLHLMEPIPIYDHTCAHFEEGLAYYASNENSLYAKIYAWSLVQYSKVIYVEVTTIPFVNFDPLFDYPGYPISAPVSSFPSEFFNSRLMVLTPSKVIFEYLINDIHKVKSPDCTETGYLNMMFPYWFEERQGNSFPFHVYAESSLPWLQYRFSYETNEFTLGRSLPMMSGCTLDDSAKTRGMAWPWSSQKNVKELVISTFGEFEKKLSEETGQTMETPQTGDMSLETPSCAGLQLSLPSQTPPMMKIEPGHSFLQAYVTFIQNNERRFIQSAQAMYYSLHRRIDPKRPIVAMVTPFVTEDTVNILKRTGFVIREIESLRHPLEDVCGRSKWNSKDGNSEVAKIRVWELEEYEKVVYIDADVLVIDNIDDMFDHPGSPVLTAAPGMFPPTEFNAGVMVLTPQSSVFKSMLATFRDYGSSDCGDQGFLNAFYRKWYSDAPSEHRLRTRYNTHFRVFTMRNLTDRSEYWNAIQPKLLHFSGRSKPWIESLLINDVNWSYRWNQTYTAACVHAAQSNLANFIAKVTTPRSNIALIGFYDFDQETEQDLLQEELALFQMAKREVAIVCTQNECDFDKVEDTIGENGVIFFHGNSFVADGVDFTQGNSALERTFDVIARFQKYQKVFLPRVLTDLGEFPPEIQNEMQTWFDHRYRVLFSWLDTDSYRMASGHFQALSVNLLAPGG